MLKQRASANARKSFGDARAESFASAGRNHDDTQAGERVRPCGRRLCHGMTYVAKLLGGQHFVEHCARTLLVLETGLGLLSLRTLKRM